MSIQDHSTAALVEARERYRDRLATLPRWRWLARYILGLAVDGLAVDGLAVDGICGELADRRSRRR